MVIEKGMKKKDKNFGKKSAKRRKKSQFIQMNQGQIIEKIMDTGGMRKEKDFMT